MNGDELKTRFGRRIQELREAKGLTQDQLAQLIGRTVNTVSNIERGVNSTRVETANQLAQVLGVRLPDLFELGGEHDPVEKERQAGLKAISALLGRSSPAAIQRARELLEAGLRLAEASKDQERRDVGGRRKLQ